MPSWKKVILSGSDAALNSLEVTTNVTATSFTGSLLGTASYADQALSASYAPGTSQTLQQVTDNGNTTTNSITASGLSSLDDVYVSSSKSYYLGADSYLRRETNSGGYESIQLNGSIRLNPNTAASANNGVIIGGNGYLLAPNSSRNAQLNYGGVSGQLGVFRLNVYGGDSIFQQSVDITGSLEVLGGITGSLLGTASYATQALTASYANTATSSSYALNTSNAVSSSYALSSSYSLTATSASHALNANNSISASYAATASSADNFNVRTSLTASGLIYPSTDGTLNQAIVTDGSGNLTFADVVASTANNTVTTGKNVSGAPIAKGTPLYFTGSGTSGNIVGILPADAGNPARMPAGGIAGEAIADGAEGVVFINGYIGGVNTSAFTSGDEVYVAVGGGYTNIVPTGSAKIQKLGNVEKADVNGSGVINGPGAARSVPNINPGYTWVGDGDWVATPISTASLFVTSASYAITSTSASHALISDAALTATSASHALNANDAISSSYAVSADTASFLPATTNLNIASITASNAVFQSASIGFLQTVTGSATVIGDAFILLNTGDAQRYAGLLVEDSGSALTNYTSSFFYDSELNDWNYEYTTTASTDYGVALFGPEYNTKGSPTYLTANRIPKAEGTHHLNDSNLSDDGSRVSSAVSLTVTGSITGSDVTIDDWGSISASLASIEAGVATQNLQDVTDNGNTTTNSIAVTGLTSSIVGGDGITGTFRSTNGYNRLLLISTGSTGTNYGQVNIILRDSSGGANNDGTITYGGAQTATLRIKTVNDNEFQLYGSTTNHRFSFSDGGTGSLNWNASVPFIQRTGGGQTQFLGLATSASYSTQALSASFAVTASYVATASYTPNLQQVTNAGNITSNDIIVTGSSADSLRINSEGFIVSGSLSSGPTNGKTHQVIYSALSVSANSTTTIAQLPAPAVAGFTFDYVAYVSGNVLQAGRAGVVKGILRNTETGVVTKAFQINETTTLDLEDQGFGTEGLQFTIVQDTNGTSNQLVAITNNTWPYEINYTLTIYYNPNFS